MTSFYEEAVKVFRNEKEKNNTVITIPKGATNEEVIKTIFPNAEIKISSASESYKMIRLPDTWATISRKWMESKYEGGE